ncbi:hypothetical protein [Oceaniglobus roseus]|uniref:hypothetical protein n=1 Tax=Oceaniglobus roseus TaxID=1737570 RepID=UPI000C7EB8EB|nr:hypothetical protein [Kandeliimicrobium roseum]
MFRTAGFAALLALAPLAAAADDVTDTLQSALDAYNAGDIQYALEELAFATQLIKSMKAGDLAQLLPAAQDGWSREIDEDEARGLGAMGGTAAVARYEKDGQSFTIQILADSPMVASFGSVFGNAALMASMGKIERVGREKFMNQDGDLTGMIGNRILVQAQGGETADMISHLETMDFKALEGFGA